MGLVRSPGLSLLPGHFLPLLPAFQICQVLICHRHQRNSRNLHLPLFDQVQQKIEWTFKNWQMHNIAGFLQGYLLRQPHLENRWESLGGSPIPFLFIPGRYLDTHLVWHISRYLVYFM